MRSKIDRTGEESINNFGSKMIITRYNNARDIDIYFPEYDWTAKNVEYRQFKNGQIKCPYERRTYGVGYLGEGEYKTKEKWKKTKCYVTWKGILERCCDETHRYKNLSYINCEVCEEWSCYTNFSQWFKENYYEIEDERMCLDKDILYKGNKVYSPNTCIFVPERINTLFIKHDNSRGKYPIGVTYHKQTRKFQTSCNIYDFKENKTKSEYLGLYDTPEKAFQIYKQFKEKNIKEVADYYKDKIPNKLYQALYNYEVEITD